MKKVFKFYYKELALRLKIVLAGIDEYSMENQHWKNMEAFIDILQARVPTQTIKNIDSFEGDDLIKLKFNEDINNNFNNPTKIKMKKSIDNIIHDIETFIVDFEEGKKETHENDILIHINLTEVQDKNKLLFYKSALEDIQHLITNENYVDVPQIQNLINEKLNTIKQWKMLLIY